MQIIARGKNIDTHLLKNLLIQGEKNSETVLFLVDRFYNGFDLNDCDFIIKGVTEGDAEAEQALVKRALDEKIAVIWNISEDFTAESGKLILEMRAVLIDEDTETETLVLKYDMADINVKPSPIGSTAPVPSAVEQAINLIGAATADGLSQIQALIDSFDIEALNERLAQIEEKLAELLERPEIQPITQQEYNRIQHLANVLYVIVEE